MSKTFVVPVGVDLEEFWDGSPQEENNNLLENSPIDESSEERKCPKFLDKVLNLAADLLGFAGK